MPSPQYSQQKTIYVICEGQSEYAYIQKLRNFLNDKGIQLDFLPYKATNGTFTNLKKCYSDKKKNNNKAFGKNEVIFFADWDMFFRDKHNQANNTKTNNFTQYQEEKEKLPNFYFSYHNFEDFISLHLQFEQAADWCKICVNRDHFNSPMHSKIYEPLFKQLVIGYTKGELPPNFVFKTGLENLKAHATNRKLHQSGLNQKSLDNEHLFSSYLLTKLKEAGLEF